MASEGPQVSIRVQANGPYILSGGAPVVRRRSVLSADGEPLTWQTTERLETRSTVALCRCGGSANKPFCDGTHARNGFDGTETAASSTYDERATTYEGAGVVVRDDRSVCEHAGFCSNRATNVWKMVGGPAIEDPVTRGQMMAMIEHCPSGALTFRMTPDGPDVEPELAVGVGVVVDGPYFVTGGIPVQRSDGAPFETRNRVTLCRCGQSANKPLCDGSHKSSGFQDS
ncbi:MAG TPA: CDGSH iron-sulfur domain-containing protein [Acidimicrobiales bacterium]|nr:CDGSH iron-sulfur domain-containing protein [Acidimicrobiales bacterium]